MKVEEKMEFDNRNLNDRIYYYIRDLIVKNEFKPGSRIKYNELINMLGVSRTPLRDAINRLERDGLVEVKARSGTYVSVPKAKDIIEIYDLRRALELLALELSFNSIKREELERLMEEANDAELAIDKGDTEPFFQADRKFHRLFIHRSNNTRLIQIMEMLEVQIEWFRVIITKNFDRPKQANDKHKKIIEALYNEDLNKAKELMAAHIEEIKKYTISDFS